MARKRYTDEVQARAILLGYEYGPAEAARRTGITKGTIASWMSRSGVATVACERTKAATARVKATAEERRTRLADRMLDLAEMGADQAQELIGDASLRDVVGLFTRAIHDHQLLSGQATARTEQMIPEDAHAIIDKLAERRTA